MQITYLGHSGFSVRTHNHLLIFDALRAPVPKPEDHAIAFVSHGHEDHYWPAIRRWHEEGLCALVSGEGLAIGGICLKRGERADVLGAHVQAFGSTDAGSSFLACVDGMKIYHAGDFNLWSWRDESTPLEIAEADRAFSDMLADLKDLRPDVAFFPVDPRMQTDYDEGALRFAQAVRPRRLIPMHFWDQPNAALDFARRDMPQGVEVLPLVQPGQCVDLPPTENLQKGRAAT